MTACANIENCISKKVTAVYFQSTNRNRWALRRIVAKWHNNRALKITKELKKFMAGLLYRPKTWENTHLVNGELNLSN